MKITIIATFLISTFILHAQNFVEQDSVRIQDKFYTECFENLSHGNEILQTYPFFEENKICSIMECLILLESKNDDLKSIATNRLVGIATQLANKKTPVILISGMDSSLTANEKNFNVEDDDGIIYVSIAACVMSQSLSLGQKAFNNQTINILGIKRNGT